MNKPEYTREDVVQLITAIDNGHIDNFDPDFDHLEILRAILQEKLDGMDNERK